jgi:hypothetical protein
MYVIITLCIMLAIDQDTADIELTDKFWNVPGMVEERE